MRTIRTFALGSILFLTYSTFLTHLSSASTASLTPDNPEQKESTGVSKLLSSEELVEIFSYLASKNLSPEVLIEIFSYLSSRDVMQLSESPKFEDPFKRLLRTHIAGIFGVQLTKDLNLDPHDLFKQFMVLYLAEQDKKYIEEIHPSTVETLIQKFRFQLEVARSLVRAGFIKKNGMSHINAVIENPSLWRTATLYEQFFPDGDGFTSLISVLQDIVSLTILNGQWDAAQKIIASLPDVDFKFEKACHRAFQDALDKSDFEKARDLTVRLAAIPGQIADPDYIKMLVSLAKKSKKFQDVETARQAIRSIQTDESIDGNPDLGKFCRFTDLFCTTKEETDFKEALGALRISGTALYGDVLSAIWALIKVGEIEKARNIIEELSYPGSDSTPEPDSLFEARLLIARHTKERKDIERAVKAAEEIDEDCPRERFDAFLRIYEELEQQEYLKKALEVWEKDAGKEIDIQNAVTYLIECYAFQEAWNIKKTDKDVKIDYSNLNVIDSQKAKKAMEGITDKHAIKWLLRVLKQADAPLNEVSPEKSRFELALAQLRRNEFDLALKTIKTAAAKRNKTASNPEFRSLTHDWVEAVYGRFSEAHAQGN
jgi:hypothetical protein